MIVLDAKLKKELQKKYQDEQVLIIPTQHLSSIGDRFTKISSTEEGIAKVDKLMLDSKYVYRYDAEYNSAFQQVIPYCVIRNRAGNKFFVNERLSGETRLVSNLSLGFGGHINPEDGRHNALYNGLIRELNEEVSLPENTDKRLIGYVRDLTSDLTDHTGFIFELTTANMSETKIKETDKMNGYWSSLDELADNYYRFEGWSRYLIDYYYDQRKNNM